MNINTFLKIWFPMITAMTYLIYVHYFELHLSTIPVAVWAQSIWVGLLTLVAIVVIEGCFWFARWFPKFIISRLINKKQSK